uniref:Uncharacterized protein n=1 Tax=Anguilla anguilla TaxID=7936 RepID=A0A0E9T8F8_ANGAN
MSLISESNDVVATKFVD